MQKIKVNERSPLLNMLNYHGSIRFGNMFLMDSAFFTFVSVMFIMGIDVHLQNCQSLQWKPEIGGGAILVFIREFLNSKWTQEKTDIVKKEDWY